MTKPTYTVAEMAAGLRAIHKYQDDFYYKSSMQEDELALLLAAASALEAGERLKEAVMRAVDICKVSGRSGMPLITRLSRVEELLESALREPDHA